MNIEEARAFALSMPEATEELFANTWISFRIHGKWFMLIQTDAPEPRVAVKLAPEVGVTLREQYEGVTAAYHMNKEHWDDLYLEKLPADLIRKCIKESYDAVSKKK